MGSKEGNGPATSRRRLLRAVGLTGVASGLAGCAEVTSYEFEATPVVLDEGARSSLGAADGGRTALEAELQRTVAGVEATVTVVSHVSTYETDAERGTVAFGDGPTGRAPTDANGTVDVEYRKGGGEQGAVGTRSILGTPIAIGVLATPTASVGGRRLNPLATAPLGDLVTGPRGRDLLARLGVDPDAKFLRPLEPAGAVSPSDLVGATTPSDLAGAVTPSDYVGAISPSDYAGAVTPSDIERFVGVVREESGAERLVVVTAARSERDGGDDVVVVAGVQQRPLPADADVDAEPLVGDGGLVGPAALLASAARWWAFVPSLVPADANGAVDPDAYALQPGEYVSDGDDGTPDLATAIAVLDAPIDDWTVFPGETVADQNPNCDPTDSVVVVAYEHLLDAGLEEWRELDRASLFDAAVASGVKFHAFPRSRLQRHLVRPRSG